MRPINGNVAQRQSGRFISARSQVRIPPLPPETRYGLIAQSLGGLADGQALWLLDGFSRTCLVIAIEGTGRIGYNETSDGHAPGRLAQLVRALASHARGQRFKSSIAHHSRPIQTVLDGITPKWRNGRRAAFRAQCPLRAWEFKSPLRHHYFLL